MPQWNKSKLLTAVVAAGLVAGMTVATPSALADPDAPDPGVAAAPIDPGLPTEAPLPPPIPPDRFRLRRHRRFLSCPPSSSKSGVGVLLQRYLFLTTDFSRCFPENAPDGCPQCFSRE